jgi:hypothetical protein
MVLAYDIKKCIYTFLYHRQLCDFIFDIIFYRNHCAIAYTPPKMATTIIINPVQKISFFRSSRVKAIGVPPKYYFAQNRSKK